MPAKSAAYEKGIREGRAMAARSRNPEASEPEEEEEMDMAANHSRKRSAKGAKHTKRLDLKCGKGSISEGEKCTKGAAQKVQPKQPSKARTIASAGAILGGVALNAGATGYGLGKALTGDLAGAGRAFQLAGAGQALTGVGARGIGLKKESNRLLTSAALTAGAGTFLREGTTGELGKLARRMRQKTKQVRYLRSNAKGRARMAAIRNAPLPQPRMKNGRVADPWNNDSVFASGFSLDSGSFDI